MTDYFHLQLLPQQVQQLSALALAHCGDAVFELMVRTHLCTQGMQKPIHLHRAAVAMVRAGAQAERITRILPFLTEQELAFYKRGRNAHVHMIPKNATHEEYAKATGLECLFGALYLCGSLERLNELFLLSMEDANAT